MKVVSLALALPICTVTGCARSATPTATARNDSSTDRGTPEAAYASAAAALRDGDAAAVRECFVASPPNQPMLDWLIASARFRAASDRRFGPDVTLAVEAKSATYSARQMGLAMLERVKRPPGGGASPEADAAWQVPARRGPDGRWRIELIVVDDTEPEDATAGVNDLLQGATAAVSRVTADIEAGRLTTPAQVWDALGMGAR